MNRRVEQSVLNVNRSGGKGSFVKRTRYLNRRYELIAEFSYDSATNAATTEKSYSWGLDVSGTAGGAGGIGGLWMIAEKTLANFWYPSYDGRGNITALFHQPHLGTTTRVAEFDYDPFGQTVLAKATNATHLAACPFRWQTKWSMESGLETYSPRFALDFYDFGLRWYSIEQGRFLNRYPIGEAGGNNLYGYVGNDPINAWDLLGMNTIGVRINVPTGTDTERSNTISFVTDAILGVLPEGSYAIGAPDETGSSVGFTTPSSYLNSPDSYTVGNYIDTGVNMHNLSYGGSSGGSAGNSDVGSSDMGSSGKENAWDAERRKKCQQLMSAWASSLRQQVQELAIIAQYQGNNAGAVLRVGGDAAAFLESAVDTAANSGYQSLGRLQGTRGLEFANEMTNRYTLVVGAIDLLNAYGAFQGDASNGFKPDWGGVSYNLGSAGTNALSLYLGSNKAQSALARHPATGLALGFGALTISFGQEAILNNIANNGIKEAQRGYLNAFGRGIQARAEFLKLNCLEFYGSGNENQ